MIIRRRSLLTGLWHELDLPITAEQFAAYEGGELVQVAFPHLTPAQREFLISGATEEEWDEHMRMVDDEDEAEAELQEWLMRFETIRFRATSREWFRR